MGGAPRPVGGVFWGGVWPWGAPEARSVQVFLLEIFQKHRIFKDALDRQIMERIQIQNFKGPVLMNRRSEMGGVRVERMQYRRWGGD